MLLSVFDVLLQRRDDLVLIIGGSTFGNNLKYAKKLKQIASSISKNKIIFTGFSQNVGKLISEFDVFVFLSLSENLGGVFESLLFKVPTVASDRGGIPELVINGETGFTCDLKSIYEIADKIEVLLKDKVLVNNFRVNGQQRVFDVFDYSKSIENSYEIYKKLLQFENYQSNLI
jgi:glycosyltransferase involved in cell wall biosynthesis